MSPCPGIIYRRGDLAGETARWNQLPPRRVTLKPRQACSEGSQQMEAVGGLAFVAGA